MMCMKFPPCEPTQSTRNLTPQARRSGLVGGVSLGSLGPDCPASLRFRACVSSDVNLSLCHEIFENQGQLAKSLAKRSLIGP